jgi:tripartite-type tricarboxylate transporter receptor subunit TctC
MPALFARLRPASCVHLAAQAGVRYSLEHPHAYLDANLAGTLNILEGCRHNPVSHLVYASSSSVYGSNAVLPFSVRQGVDHPLSLYAATKKANEMMAHSYSHLYGIPTTGLRFFTVYGPWGRPDMAMFIFAKAILSGSPIQLFNHGEMLRDFTYICGLSSYTMGIVVRADSPWKTIEDLIAAGRKEPEKYTYGTSGVGGSGNLFMIEIDQATGAKFTHVPFKGGAEWTQALLAGHIDFLADAAQWAPFVDAGQFRILAMATEQRIPKYPQAPTLRERGINAIAHSPYGLVGPKDLPAPIVQSIYEAFNQATDDPGLQPILDRYIQVPWRRNPAEYRAYAEQYFNSIKPLLIKSGLAKG